MNNTLSIGLVSPVADSVDFVLLEQDPWDESVGKTTTMQGIQNIAAALFGGDFAESNCGGEDGVVCSRLFVYPSRVTLSREISVSHGSIALLNSGMVQREELRQCQLQDSVVLQYPALGTVRLQWVGECYGEAGNIVTSPGYTVSNNTIFFDKKVYGSFHAVYRVFREEYSLDIPARDDSIENNFQSVAVARWSGGIAWKELDIPANFDLTDGDCGNGSSVSVDPEEETDEDVEDIICPDGEEKYRWPVSVTADRLLLVNYCKQSANTNTVDEEVEYEQRCSKYAPIYLID